MNLIFVSDNITVKPTGKWFIRDGYLYLECKIGLFHKQFLNEINLIEIQECHNKKGK